MEDTFLRPNETEEQLYFRCTNTSHFDCSEATLLWLMMGPPRLPLAEIVPISVALLVVFLTGVAGNVAVCVVIVRHPSMRTTTTNYYLFSLALSDLLLLLFGLPNDLSVYWHQYPYSLGIVFCKLRALISEAASYVSVLTIVAFSLERYLAICQPLHLYAMAGLRRALRIVAGLWLVALVAASPFAVYTTVNYHDYPPESGNASLESAFCAMLELPSWYLCELSSLLFFILPGIIILCLYVRMGLRIRYVMGASGMFAEARTDGFHAVMRKKTASLVARVRASTNSILSVIADKYDCPIMRHWARVLVGFAVTVTNPYTISMSTHTNKPGSPGTLNGVNGSVHGEARQAQSRKTIIRMLAAVVVAFFVCWAPFHFQRLFFIYGTNSRHYHAINQYVFYVTGVLYYVSATVNPILYNAMSRRYKNAFRETLCCSTFHRKKSKYLDHSSIRETIVNHTSDGALVRIRSQHERRNRIDHSLFRRGSSGETMALCDQNWKDEGKKKKGILRNERSTSNSNNNDSNQVMFNDKEFKDDYKLDTDLESDDNNININISIQLRKGMN